MAKHPGSEDSHPETEQNEAADLFNQAMSVGERRRLSRLCECRPDVSNTFGVGGGGRRKLGIR